ncbi:UDP-2,3-diacylglucosamine diphosphatase [Rhodoferax sp. 4810]|uniref:UDP-2,3-diacylglucosamine hydrolase n=1 Tax=Thiospirillum jenense TaxID=1653858 RepID=A0A839HB85_9GAMM|nr:UDP-2,3-diacylglucosamine diphosphatase [Thiospirillum jenense]MBB1076316.1 UDP-2,3-diacylglucosamine diphosphatase [Rhodoferax jenense]MBB1126273.1 UDP-2,3-diacylglucosamine diphosphatase [Thiospirillum jenense]
MTQAIFIADLHLTPQRPQALRLFQFFLQHRARRAAAVYILGDLFDTWIGDDDVNTHYDAVRQALRDFTKSGRACYLMRGNRDFLIGQRFAAATGCILVNDPWRIEINDEPVLLTHGDLLCTDDVAYQKFRRRIRHPIIKWLFLRQSLTRRQRIAADYRRRGQLATAMKSLEIMDVNQLAVEAMMTAHQVTHLIHGHTHRPGDYYFTQAQHAIQRRVLADWHDDCGELLVTDAGQWWREIIQQPTGAVEYHQSSE